MKIAVPIGLLVDAIAEYKDVKLLSNQAVPTMDLICKVATPLGDFTPIKHIIKKENLQGFEFTINGNIIGCADTHIFQQNGLDIYAHALSVGDYIDTIDGHSIIDQISFVTSCDYYDISIDNPHLYVDTNGIIHHNTLITAALSYSCEAHGKSIVIVPNKSLVTQTEADYRNLGLDVGVYYGDRKEFGHTHTICTWQSINILMKKSQECSEPATSRLLRDPTNVNIHDLLDGVICIMVDECFDGNTNVLTPNGYVPIKDIKSGDLIVNYSENLKEFKVDMVVKHHVNLTKSNNETMYELEFDNGKKIQVTGNHKFLTNLGWCRADELTENHEVVNKI